MPASATSATIAPATASRARVDTGRYWVSSGSAAPAP